MISEPFTRDLRIAIFSSFPGIAIAILFKCLRGGLDDNSYLDLIKILGFLFFLLFASLIVNQWAQKGGKKNFIFHPSVSVLVFLIFFCAIGIFNPASFVIWLFSVCGLALFGYHFFLFLRICTRQDLLVSLPFTLMASITSAAYIYCTLAKPHLLEALATQHIPYNWPTDTLFHSSILQMITTYGVPSTGINGVPFFNYHFGSHFIFSALTGMLQVEPLRFYLLACPVIFTSIFFFVFLQAIVQFAKFLKKEKKNLRLGFLFWLLFFMMFFGLLKRGFIWHNGIQVLIPGIVGNSAIFVSESYLLSMILLFVMFTIMLLGAEDEPSFSRAKTFYLFGSPVLLFVIAVIKISTGFILFSVLGYLYLRYRLYRKRAYNLSLLVHVVVWFFAYNLVHDRSSSEGLITFQFLQANHLNFVLAFLVVHYAWVGLLVALFVLVKISGGISIKPSATSMTVPEIHFESNPLSKVSDAIKAKRSIFVEIALVIAIAGLIPTIVLNLGGNGAFFSEIQFYFAIAVLLGYFLSVDLKFLADRLSTGFKKWTTVILVLSYGYLFLSNTLHFMRDMLESNFTFRKTVVGDYSYSSPRLKLKRLVGSGQFNSADSLLTVYGQTVQERLDTTKSYMLLRKLQELNALPRDQKKQSLIYIDHDHSGVTWYIPCYDILFLVPALTGIAQLDGIASIKDCQVLEGWGFSYYKVSGESKKEVPYTDDELCKMTRERGFSQLIIYRPQSARFETLKCQ